MPLPFVRFRMTTRTTRSAHLEFARLFQAAIEPAYALDDERRIVFANGALGRWAGIEAAELVGRQCRYQSAPEIDGAASIADALCPPPEVIAGKRMSGRLTSSAAGIASVRMAEFVPLTSESG